MNHWAPSAIFSGAALTTCGAAMGNASSCLCNLFYYSVWKAGPYMSPSAMQVAFHGVFWVGFPGLIMGWRSLSQAFSDGTFSVSAVEERRSTRGLVTECLLRYITQPPSVVHHYHHHEETRPDPKALSSEEKKEETKGETSKVAPYEGHDSAVWLTLFVGVGYSFYHSFKWAYSKSRSIASRAARLIENVD